jgi:hypothetical protein
MRSADTAKLSWSVLGIAVLVLALGAPPAEAGSMGTGTYRCTINISPVSSHDCHDGTGIVTLTTNSGNARVARIDLNQSFTWLSVNVLVDVCNPTGWTVNIGDSPTNNGGGGDSSSTRHDTEAELNGTGVNVYYSDIGGTGRHTGLANAVATSGCSTLQWTVVQDSLSYDDDGNTADTPRVTAAGSLAAGTHLFDFPPYNEADSEDSSGADADKLYLGLNRTIFTASRSGTGVNRACIFLSTSATPSPATIASECAF